jgi:hypothetical protein
VKVILFFLNAAFSLTLYSQKIQGLYITGNDFISNKLSFTKSNTTDCKIKSGLASGSPFLKFKYKDSIFRIEKEKFFGYKDKTGIVFRFYNGISYEILNPGEEILLYKTEKNIGTPKYPELLVNYYFSKDAGSPIEKLSLNTVLSSFQSDPAFSNLIELHFRSDNELMEFDNYYKKYKLNRLLELSSEKK